jgi:uncharacterized metal-binding protein YceD (DUF177 family)
MGFGLPTTNFIKYIVIYWDMLLRIKDIPTQGREINFDLDNETLNARISVNVNQEPDYTFTGPIKAILKASLQGTTVMVEGKVYGDFTTICGRCADKVTKHLEVPVNMVLKPSKAADPSEQEDLNFGYYDGEVVNFAEISEELMVLALPMVVKCESKNCAENKESWVFGEEIESNNPFKNIKLVH